MTKERAAGTANRYIILASAAFASLVSGLAYAWSIFQKPLMELRGWEANEVSLAYSISFLFVFVGILTNGFIKRRFSARSILLTAGLLRGMGFLLTGFAETISQLYFAYAVLSGLGGGYLYSTAVSVATQWFPDKKGFANGLCLGCTGLAPLFFSPLGNALIEHFDVLSSFKILGVSIIIGMFVASLFIRTPPQGWKPEGYAEPAKSPATENADRATHDRPAPKAQDHLITATKDRTPHEAIHTSAFWTMWGMTVCACTSGMMMTGQAAFIAQEIASATPSQGAILVGMLAVCSFSGRLLFGALSDKLGRLSIQAALLVVTAVDMLFFFNQVHDFGTFLAAMGLVGLCFGGAISILPAMVSDTFGMQSFETNYALVFSGHTIASFLGPLLASTAYQTTGSFSLAFNAAGLIAAGGFVLAMASIFAVRCMYVKDIRAIPSNDAPDSANAAYPTGYHTKEILAQRDCSDEEATNVAS